MARPSETLLELTREFVCVRVTDMSGVDLSRYRFDYDLTFTVLLMHADGTVYHTYGGRSSEDPKGHLSLEGLTSVLRATLAEHAAYQQSPRPPLQESPFTVEQYPAMAARIAAGERPECVHCHTVHDVWVRSEREAGSWRNERAFVWPDPVQVGLRLATWPQSRVTEVVQGSPALDAGLRAGDLLLELGGRSLLTFGDVQRVLHEAPAAAGKLAVRWRREDAEREGELVLADDWKNADPEVFAWRAIKWPLFPKPGFGGPLLSRSERREHGLHEDAFAFRVNYLVTWGRDAWTGRHAAVSGIRKGDVVLGTADKQDFTSVEHFHAWFRLTQKPGTTTGIQILRDGARRTVRLEVLDAPP